MDRAFNYRAGLLLALMTTAAPLSAAQNGVDTKPVVDSGIPDVPPTSTAAPVGPSPSTVQPEPAPKRTILQGFLGRRSAYPVADDSDVAIKPITNLRDAIALAYEHHPELLEQRALLRSYDFKYPEARALYGMTIQATGDYVFTRDRFETLPGQFTPDSGFTTTAGATVSQPLTTFGRSASAVQLAVADIDYERCVLRQKSIEIMQRVVTAYVNVVHDAAAVTLAEQNLALLQRQYTDNSARYRVREITSSDLFQVETRLNFQRAQVLLAKGQLAASQALFLRDVGAPPGELEVPSGLVIPTDSIDQAYAWADEQSPTIRLAQAREKISRSNVFAAKAEFRPRVDLSGSAEYGTMTLYASSLRTTRVVGQVQVTVPIYKGGFRRAQLNEYYEANASDRYNIDAAVRTSRAAVASAWNELSSTRASLEHYAVAVRTARQAFEGARLQQRGGDRTTLDVLDLARDLLQVQTGYNTAVANEFIARAALLAAIGQLDAPRLVDGIQVYDPTAHFRKVQHSADIPLLTSFLANIDGLAAGSIKRDRAIRDKGTGSVVYPLVPLDPNVPTASVSQITQGQ